MFHYPVRIRFVGGYWHNRVEAVQALTQSVFLTNCPGKNRYHLARFFSIFGTEYFQYIHSSLICGDAVARCAHQERTPSWRIDEKKLDARLRNRMRLTKA